MALHVVHQRGMLTFKLLRFEMFLQRDSLPGSITASSAYKLQLSDNHEDCVYILRSLSHPDPFSVVPNNSLFRLLTDVMRMVKSLLSGGSYFARMMCYDT